MNDFNVEKDWDFPILQRHVTQCIDFNDLDLGLQLARKGLDTAREEDESEWIDVFEKFVHFIENEKKFMNTHVEHEKILPKGERKKMQVEGDPAPETGPGVNEAAKVKKTVSELSMIEGIGPKTLEILASNGITTFEQLASKNPRTLQDIKGIGERSAEKCIDAARRHLGQASLTEYMERSEGDEDQMVSGENSFNYMHELGKENVDIQQVTIFGDDDMVTEEPDESEKSTSNITESLNARDQVNEDINFDSTPSNEIQLIDVDSEPEKGISMRETTRKRKKTSKRSLSPLQTERLTQEETEQVIKDLEVNLRSLDYWILTKKIDKYSTLLKTIDLLAIRSIEISDFLELIIFLPIKISTGKGKHRVYEEEIQYVPENRKVTLSPLDKKILVENNADVVKGMTSMIFEDVVTEGPLFEFLSKYLKKSLKIEKSLAKKELFLTTGDKYHEVLIFPTLIVDNDVEFLESSMAPFAWQRETNLHVIDSMNVKDYVAYVEKKHVLIETHSTKQDLIDGYIASSDKFFYRMGYFTLPFMIYAGSLFFIILFSPSLLSTFIALGIGLMILLGIGSGYFLGSLFKTQSKLHETFVTPYYKRPVYIDESGIIMIKEELPEEWMHQFIYECDMNTKELDTVRNFEREGHLEKLNETQEQFDENEEYSEEKPRLCPSMEKKYSKFLED